MAGLPYLIGLTGNIATGKSEVGQILSRLGATVIDADRVAHEVMEPQGPAYGPVVEAFGPGILAEDGSIDRTRLGHIVFRDPAALRRLEAAVHPATIAEVGRRIAHSDGSVVVVEAIKLIEAGMHRSYNELWVVTAPRPLQIERLVEKRGLSEAEAALRVDAQPPQEEKARLADRVFANDSTLAELEDQVCTAWAEIQQGPEPALQGPDGSRSGRPGDMSPEPGQTLQIRRARQQDMAAIASLVQAATPAEAGIRDAEVMDWLFSKGLWLAEAGGSLLGVAAWQAENLLAVTDVFCVSASHPLLLAGGPLLERTEAEAALLMCEANVMVLQPWTSGPVRDFLRERGYEPTLYGDLHSIWREVLEEFLTRDEDLMVKRLRERMVMVPL